MMRASIVERKIRRRQTALAGAAASSHVDTPRFAKSPQLPLWSTFASKVQRSRPVAGSRAMTRPNGVDRYIVPSTTRGVASNFAGRRVASFASPVRYVHATVRRETLPRSI